jgi:putative (di)nucleoside polyphosphate hydrolase
MKPYKGQTQRYFLVKLKEEAKISLDTEHPEFNEYKFVDVDKVLGFTAHFKKPVYETVLAYFKEEGYL